MAILRRYAVGPEFAISTLAPQGTFPARCIDVKDEFNVTRKHYSSGEPEKVDLTRLLFEFLGHDGIAYQVQSQQMRISGNPKSNLMCLLTTWLGRPPEMGWDYCSLKGKPCLLTVKHEIRRDGTETVAVITDVRPLPPNGAHPITAIPTSDDTSSMSPEPTPWPKPPDVGTPVELPRLR